MVPLGRGGRSPLYTQGPRKSSSSTEGAAHLQRAQLIIHRGRSSSTEGGAHHPQRAELIIHRGRSSSTEGAAHHPQRAQLIHRGCSSSSTEGAAHPQRVQLIHRGRSSSTEGAPRGCEAFSVGSCQGASFSIEQNGNKCVLRNNPAKEWPSIEFFFIFNDLVARMNSKCQMKYLSTIKNRHVQLCYLNSMLLSS